MSEEGTPKKFDLIFEGPADESVKTLQKIKGAFISDLEFPIEEVQRILSQAPLTIYSSESEDQITDFYNSLKNAGGKVLIVRPKTDEGGDAPQESSGEMTLDFTELEVGFDEKDLTPKEPKVYSLDVDDVLFNTVDTDESEEKLQRALEEAKQSIPTPALEEDAPLFPGLTKPEEEKAPPLPEQNKDDSPLFSLDTLSIGETIPHPAPIETVPAISSPSQEPPTDEILFQVESPNPASPKSEADLSSEIRNSLSLLEIDEPAKEEEKAPAEPQAKDSVSGLSIELSAPDPVIETLPLIEKDSPIILEPEEPVQKAPPAADDLIIAPLQSVPIEEVIVSQIPELPKPVEEPVRNLKELFSKKKEKKPQETSQEAQPHSQTSDEPSKIEEAAKEAEAATPPLKSSSLKEIAVPFLIGIALLAGGNWVYTTLFTDYDSSSVAITPDMLAVPREAEAKKSTALDPNATVRFEFEDRASSVKVKSSFSVLPINGTLRPVGLSVLFEPPPPRELTPEEVVKGTRRDPWLYKVDVDGIQFENAEPGTITGKGPVKFIIDDGGNRVRGAAQASIVGTLNEHGDEVTLTVKVTNEITKEPAEDIIIPSLTKGGKYQIYLKKQITLKKR